MSISKPICPRCCREWSMVPWEEREEGVEEREEGEEGVEERKDWRRGRRERKEWRRGRRERKDWRRGRGRIGGEGGGEREVRIPCFQCTFNPAERCAVCTSSMSLVVSSSTSEGSRGKRVAWAGVIIRPGQTSQWNSGR